MPGGVWAQQIRAGNAGGYGVQAPKPASPFDTANQYLRGGGSSSDFGRGINSVVKRQFADVGKANINLLDPLAMSRGAVNYQPVDGEDGGLLGIGNYYNPQQPGGLFAGLFGGIAQTVGGIFGEEAAKTGSDIGTMLGKTIEAPLAIVGSAGMPFVAPVIDQVNSEIEKVTPYILRDTLKIPTNVGGAFQSMLNIFGLAGMAVERTYAGMDARGALPPDIEERLASGELKSRDEAFDEMVLTARGYSNDVLHNLAWSLLLDPANWASAGVGLVGGAVKGTGTLARTFGSAVRADAALAEKAIAQGGRLAEVTQAALGREAITGMVDSRGLMAQMRNVIDDTQAPFQLGYVERLGMSALGPVSAETGNVVAKVGNYILRATDPVNFFSGSKAGQRSMALLSTAASTAAIAAYKPKVVLSIAKIADQLGGEGSERVYRSIGINGGNALQEKVLSDMATDAMKNGAIPRIEKLDASEAARALIRGEAYDTNVGKYLEVQIERNKDISVGMLPPEEMYNQTVNKFASLMGVDAARVRAAMKTVSSDQAILVHALYYYAKGEALHTTVLHSLRDAASKGTLKSVDPERVAIISARTLTNKTVATVDAALKTGNVGAIRQAIEKYDDFNWVHNKNVPDSELIDDVTQWLDGNRPHLLQEVDLKDATGNWLPDIPDELKTWANDSDTFGYKLGERMARDVPEEALWRVTRAPGDNGEILTASPYSDFVVEGGDSARRLNRFTATKMQMFRGIRTERIIWSQRRRFITDMATAGTDPKTGKAIPGGVNIPPALSDRIWKALMYEAKDRYIQPRGMEPREMYTTARRVLDDARKNNSSYDNLATKLTERQVVLALLRATQGEVALVGVTQKVTGGIKAFAPGSGANYWGRISERLYPLMRFTLNPVFQTMELVEPYVLNSMRGIWTPLRRESEGYQEVLATRNAFHQLVHLTAEDPDGIASETAEALAVRAYTGSEANAQFGRNRITRWMPHIGERKEVAAAMETERVMGDHMYEAFRAILKDKFEAYWADRELEFGTTNRGKIAKRWMAANFALQDVNGHQVAIFDDINKAKNIGKRMRLNKNGDKGAYTFADVETVLDHVRSYDGSWTQGLRRERVRPDGSAYEPGDALLEELQNMSREDWWEEINRSGLNNTDGIERISQKSADDIWKMANGPELDEFWNGQYTVSGRRVQGYRKAFLEGVTGSDATWTRMARDQEVEAARSFVRGWADAKNMTEEEYVKLHFEDIPQHFATVHDLNVPVSALLTEVREEWAQHALGVREMNAVPTRGIFLQDALSSGTPETHPAWSHLEGTDTATDSGYLLMKMQDSYLDDLTDAIGSGSQYYRADMPNRGYINGDRLVKDLRYGDVIVRVPKGLADDLGDVEEGIRLVDKQTIDPRSLEYLTNDGWVTMHKGKPGRIAPPEPTPRVTNTEVTTGRDVYSLNKGEPTSAEAGVTKLDIESVHHTFEERNAVEFYTGSGYVEINSFLRGVGVGPYPHLTDIERRETITQLDRAVAKGQTRERTTLYRGINMSQSKQRGEKLTIDYENLWPAGKGPAGSEATFRDPAFFSTSTGETKAREFAGFVDPDYDDVDSHLGVVLTIDAPAGTHLHQVEGYESEFLWGRGVEFRVTKRKMSHSSNHGNTLHLTVEPISDPVKPGVKRLWLGEQPQALRNEGRFLQDAVQSPEALRAQMHLPHNDTLTPEQATKMQGDIEMAIAKADAAKPAGREVIGGVTYGQRTVTEALDEIKGVLDTDEITIAAGSMADLRTRAEKLMESELWSYNTSDPAFGLRNQNNLRLLSAFAVGIAEEGGARFGMRKALQAMEMLYAKGPAAIMDPAADEATRVMGTHLVRGALYGIEQPILTNKLNDAHDAIWGNTSRRATGRVDAVQPVLADDLAAEVAGYMTPSAFDEHVARGDIKPAGAPAVIPTGEMEPTGAYLGGTTGPVQMRDPETGKLYVDKRGANPDHVREEHYTDDVYEALGIPVPHQTLLDVGGTPVKRAEMIEDGVRLDRWLETATDEEALAIEQQLQRGFALDALLANWDVIGLDGDNILVKNGVAYRVDNGGSLRFRAQGAPKGAAFGFEVSELNRMRTGNEWQQRVFGGITQAQVRRQVLELGYVMDDIKAALPPELHRTIDARYEDMLRQTEGITPAPSTGRLGAVKAELPSRPAPLGEYEHEYIVGFYNDMAKAANEQGFNGRSTWTADEMRSVASMSRQFQGREGGKAASAIELRRAMTDVRMAVGPGEGMEEFTPLFDILNQKRYRAEKQRVMAASSTYLYKTLRDQLGIVIERGDPSGVGLFDGETASGLFSVTMLGTPERMDTAADVLAYVTGQPRVTGWRLGPAVREIKDPAGYTPRASIYIPPSDITPRMAEKVAEAIGKAWPEAGDLTAVRGANGSWHLQLIDSTGELFPRLDNGFVDEERLMDFISDMLTGPNAVADIERADLQMAMEYGHLTDALPTHGPDGRVDWYAYADDIEARSAASGAPVKAGSLRAIRSSYQLEVKDALRREAPKQYDRIVADIPISGRNLEDRRGGDILGVTSPGAASNAAIRGFAAADPLTGLHELIHVFSVSGADPSMREAISKAYDEYHVGNTAAKQAKLAILQQKEAAAKSKSVRTRWQNERIALTHDLQTPHPSEWSKEHEEFFVDLVMDWIDRGVPPNPDMANAFNHFRNWIAVTKKSMSKPGLVPLQTSDQMDAMLNRMFTRPGVDTVSYSVEQQSLRMAAQHVLRGASDEAHTTHFYKKDRSMVERSINHPYIGLYPASYMWGKVLPEMLRFLALRPFGMETPFLAWNVAREISDSVSAQAELDPGFKEWLDGNEDAFMLFSMLFPGLPHDIPANASLPVRRIAEQGLEAQKAYAMGVSPDEVKDIDFSKGSQDAIQYALGPLGSIRTATEVVGMGGDLVRSTIGSAQETFAGQEPLENLPLR